MFSPFFKLAILGSLILFQSCSSKDEIKTSADGKKIENPSEQSSEDRQIQALELKEEMEIGRSMAAKLAGTKGVVKDHKITVQYLNLITQALARHAGRNEIEYSVAILRDDEPNAFATPGGFIFVTQGLLKQVQDEHEIAGVLAHEIAHITEKHLYNDLKPKRSVSAGETLTRMMSRGGSNLGQGLSQIVNQGLKSLLEEGLGTEKESAADHVGVMYAAAAGYDPQGLYRFLDRIGKAQEKLKLGKTHPPFAERLNLFDGFVKAQGLHKYSSPANPKVLESRFNKGIAKFRSSPNQG